MERSRLREGTNRGQFGILYLYVAQRAFFLTLHLIKRSSNIWKISFSYVTMNCSRGPVSSWVRGCRHVQTGDYLLTTLLSCLLYVRATSSDTNYKLRLLLNLRLLLWPRRNPVGVTSNRTIKRRH